MSFFTMYMVSLGHVLTLDQLKRTVCPPPPLPLSKDALDLIPHSSSPPRSRIDLCQKTLQLNSAPVVARARAHCSSLKSKHRQEAAKLG